MSTRNRSSVRSDDTINHTVRSRPRKNRTRWCRGRPGVEHQLVVGKLRNHWSYSLTCGWAWQEWWARSRWRPTASRWECTEQEYCRVCGKVLCYSVGARCTRRWREPQARAGRYVT